MIELYEGQQEQPVEKGEEEEERCDKCLRCTSIDRSVR